MYEWSDGEIQELADICVALITSFPSLIDIEFHIQKQAICYALEPTVPDAEPPLDIWEENTPTIKKLLDHDGRRVKVCLHQLRWNASQSKASNGVETTVDITAWWDKQRGEDAEHLSEENLEWMNGVKWQLSRTEDEWEKKRLLKVYTVT
jgi:hypothetical protein